MTKFKIDIYDCEVYLFAGDVDSFNEKLSKISGETYNSLPAEGYAGYFDTRKLFLYIKDWNYSVKSYGTLVHESVHVAKFILDNLGVSYDDENGEALTYLTDYIFQKSFKILSKLYPYEE